jgi:hypothetical protein
MVNTPDLKPSKGLPEILDSGDLILTLPYLQSISWMTRQAYEPGQGHLCATSGASTVKSFRASGRCVSGQQGHSALFGLESLSVSDVRSADAPLRSARSGGLSECPTLPAVSHRAAWSGHPFDAGRRQRAAGLPAVRSARPAAHRQCAGVVRGRRSRWINWSIMRFRVILSRTSLTN